MVWRHRCTAKGNCEERQWSVDVLFFFRIIQYNIDDHTRTYTYPYEHGRQSKGFVLGYGYQHVEWKPAVHVPKL
jgi:hypothetical protein